MQHPYRPILPVPVPGQQPSTTAPPSSSTGSNENGNGGPEGPDRSKNRNSIQPSCNHCRTKKTRCDRVRPKCSTCRRRGTDCTYRENVEVDHESTEIIDALQSLSERKAVALLRSLRATRDPTVSLKMVRRSTEPTEVSLYPNHALGTGVTPQSSLESELISCYPTAYAPLTSASAPAPIGSNLLRPVSQARSLSPRKNPDPITPPQNRADSVDGRPTISPTVDSDSAIKLFRTRGHLTAPSPVNRYCDERLRFLQIGFWTDVPVANHFAAQVISLYLTTDHPLLGLFDPLRFIADLIDQKQTFCSRFLVHALLYWGCQMYSAIDKSSHDVTDAFRAGAESIWLVERMSDSLPNMAGTQLLSLAHMGHGEDGKVMYYLAEGVRMGTRLRLLGTDEAAAQEKVDSIPDEMRTASSFAAWGVFNWAVLSSLFYRQPGLECPAFPPLIPTPGEMSSPEDAGLVRPSDIVPLPWYMGDTFSALCRFWEIIHGLIMTRHFEQKHPLHNQSKLDFAEFKYRELLAWTESLPSSLSRGVDNPHHVVILHMWLHCAVVDIFRPLIGSQQPRQARLKTFTPPNPPDAAYSASIEQLKSLVITYRSNYETSTYTILWHTALLYVANAVLQDTNNPEWRIYFLMCIYGYEALHRPYRMSAIVGQSLLSMTLRDGNMSGAQAREIVQQLKQRGLSPQRSDIRATFMADLNLAMTDAEAAKVENLAARFDELALFQDFISADGENAEMDLS